MSEYEFSYIIIYTKSWNTGNALIQILQYENVLFILYLTCEKIHIDIWIK